MTPKSLSEYYRGFVLTESVGNNAFAFEARRDKTITVPPLIKGSPADLRRGQEVVFREMRDGVEYNAPGLESFVHYTPSGKQVFIFDNHNHAFFFWFAACQAGHFPAGGRLVHVDQHKDTRRPSVRFECSEPCQADLGEVFHYTNFVLNVGNFIPPALDAGVFSEVIIVDHEAAFHQDMPATFALDIDIDIFAPAMDYIPYALKMSRIREWIGRASVITVATSPYFMDQEKAIRITRELFA